MMRRTDAWVSAGIVVAVLVGLFFIGWRLFVG